MAAHTRLEDLTGIPFTEIVPLCNRLIRTLEPLQSEYNFKFFGSAAVATSSIDAVSRWKRLGRSPIHDIDIVATVRDYRPLRTLLKDAGYTDNHPSVITRRALGGRITVWTREEPIHTLEVFADPMSWYADITFGDRLRRPGCCLLSHEIAVSKLQCDHLTQNDIVDLCILFSESDKWSEAAVLDFASFACSNWPLSWSVLRNLEVLLKDLSEPTIVENIRKAKTATERSVKTSVYLRAQHFLQHLMPWKSVGNEVSDESNI